MVLPVRQQPERTVPVHRQHVAGGVAGAEKLAVADDHAIVVRAVVITIDGQHRIGACQQLRQWTHGIRADRLPQAALRQLHIRHEIRKARLLNPVDGDHPPLVRMAVVIRLADAGLLPGKGRAQRKQQKQRRQDAETFHVDHLFLFDPGTG